MTKGRSHPVATTRANHPRTQTLRPTSQLRLSALGGPGAGAFWLQPHTAVILQLGRLFLRQRLGRAEWPDR